MQLSRGIQMLLRAKFMCEKRKPAVSNKLCKHLMQKTTAPALVYANFTRGVQSFSSLTSKQSFL